MSRLRTSVREVLLLLLVVLLGVALYRRSVPAEAGVEAEPAVTAEPAPACVHEACWERPARMVCERREAGTCAEYRFEYAQRCACDAWAQVADGGAP